MVIHIINGTMVHVCLITVVIANEDEELTPRKKRRSRNEDDDLWMPGGMKNYKLKVEDPLVCMSQALSNY